MDVCLFLVMFAKDIILQLLKLSIVMYWVKEHTFLHKEHLLSHGVCDLIPIGCLKTSQNWK